MPVPISQISFAGGEISPRCYSRVDLAKFGSAAKRIRNYFVHAEGGISNRAGTTFIKEVKDSSDIVRMITFEFNEAQAYALEFGDEYMRVYRNGGVVTETAVNISAATQANPVAVTTSSSHGYSTGDQVFISGVAGMTELNGKFFVITVTGATTFTLDSIDGSGYTAYSSGGTSARVFTLATPYSDDELSKLKFRQSNDIMYLTHRSHAPRKLSRTDHDNWTLEEINFEPNQGFPTAVAVSAQGSTGSTVYRYRVTAISADTGEESLVGISSTSSITGATQANPVEITCSSHPFSTGDEVHIDSIVGMTELNGRRFIVTDTGTNTFTLDGEDGTGHTAYSSGGTAARTFGEVTNGNATLSDSNFNRITWSAPAGDIDFYNVYKEDNGLYGYIGSLDSDASLSFDDKNIDPDLEDTAPKWRQPFQVSGDYPESVGLHEQRSVWGNTDNKPLTMWLSQTSAFENQNVSSPTKATDAISLRLVTGKGNEIRHFRSFREALFVFTSGAVWTLSPGGDADAITPSSKQLKVQEYLPSTQVPPLTIKTNILMISGKADSGFEVHSLGEDVNSGVAGNYVGSDLTVLSRHLFEGYTISEWCYIERPYRLVLAVRSDGKLLCMSYLNEHQIFAWTLWETDGYFESICNVPEGQEDTAYLVVKRTINGNDVRYVERLHTRVFSEIEDAFFVDSGLSFDGTDAKTITGATQADPVVITTSGAHGYENGDKVEISSVVGMTELNNQEFTVANKTSTTFELAGVDGSGYTAYSSGGEAQKKYTTLSGFDHLEGETVIGLFDGGLETGLTVTNGVVTSPDTFVKANVGLSYDALMESVPIEYIGSNLNTTSKYKAIKAIILRVLDTRGIFAGTDENYLEEYPTRSNELWGDPAATISNVIRVPVSSDWERDTSAIVKANPGLPQTILSMIADTGVGNG